ncbi:MAG TPA: DUF1996 domain-containing protein [Thermoleophilaceae bacterium]|nr:DUF1996 domain-containing protein [Thermoleophilaceae bacterium]
MATRIVVVLLAVAAVAPASAGAAAGTPFFPTPCGFSHRAPDDPIVAPGRPGASHSHDFLGNHSTDAFSTEASLGAAGTACRRPQDRAAYWMPTLYSHGYAIAPVRSQIYYQASGIRDVASIRPFPPGFKVIAGNAASQGAQPLSVVNWRCEGDAVAPQAAPPPSCPGDSRLRLQIRFPQCWDGQRTDSPDHFSHTAYASRGACPASHPVAVPRITLNVIYPLNRGDGIMLASGPAYTAHADFFNAWDQAELERLVSLCIHGRRGGTADCAAGASGPSPLAPLETGAPAVVHGATVLIHGRAGSRAGAPVRIEAERRGAWSAVAEVLTVAGGRFSFSFPGRASGRYRAVGPEGRPTPPLRITVRPRMALAARPRRGAISLSARSRPMKRLIVVRIERLSGARSRTFRRLVLRAERGRARTVVRVPRGRYRVRALTFGDSRHAAGRSAARDLSVP